MGPIMVIPWKIKKKKCISAQSVQIQMKYVLKNANRFPYNLCDNNIDTQG